MLSTKKSIECFRLSKYLSTKHSNYFDIYDSELEEYRNKAITFVEVGVLNGGSLFMWREFFGEDAKVIGIDFNPEAKKWEREGFQIFIGNQADPKFWESFFSEVGPVDIILDDGGHTNLQQIVTTSCCLPYINDNGKLLVEDTHASYMARFNNPSRYSFIGFVDRVIGSLHSRSGELNINNKKYSDTIDKITIYNSLISFSIDRKKCEKNYIIGNSGISDNAIDYRDRDTFNFMVKELLGIKIFSKIKKIYIVSLIYKLISKYKESMQVKKYFDL